MFNIAIDGPGGDNGLDISIPGTVKALRENSDIQVTIFGHQGKINDILSQLNVEEDIRENKIKIIHTDNKDNVPMNVKDPSSAGKNYPNSSMILSLNHVKNGESDVIVSAGNTGALVFESFMAFKRIKGITRIALAAKFPDQNGLENTLFLDVGANNEPSVKSILQNAIMGALYIKKTKGKEKPKVGLLNMGKESNKGRKIENEVFELLEANDLFEFVGNIESNMLLNNKIDVIVTDGFTGNNVLKMGEGTKEAMINMIKSKIDEKAKNLRIPQIIRGGILNMINKLFISNDGGAILLGTNSPVVKAHGGSSIEAFANAILVAYKYAKGNIIEGIKSEIVKMKLKQES